MTCAGGTIQNFKAIFQLCFAGKDARIKLAPPQPTMKTILLILALMSLQIAGFGADTNLTPEQVEAKYTAAIEGRTAEILKSLALTNATQEALVHNTLIAHYRMLRAWHDDNDAKLKAAKGDTNALAAIRVSLKQLHDSFVAKLGAELTPQQVEQVKDRLTYGKVQFTYKGYVIQYPNLSDAQKAEILRLLKEAREEAMDGGSSEEKTAVFQRYKGKINNYLSKQGVHPAKNKPADGEKKTANPE